MIFKNPTSTLIVP